MRCRQIAQRGRGMESWRANCRGSLPERSGSHIQRAGKPAIGARHIRLAGANGLFTAPKSGRHLRWVAQSRMFRGEKCRFQRDETAASQFVADSVHLAPDADSSGTIPARLAGNAPNRSRSAKEGAGPPRSTTFSYALENSPPPSAPAMQGKSPVRQRTRMSILTRATRPLPPEFPSGRRSTR